ncbi:MAG: DsrE family protein [Acidiferrobacteraceae bacterium]|jgi:intracellular sulfur oxidation DsrE/DsrF family protein
MNRQQPFLVSIVLALVFAWSGAAVAAGTSADAAVQKLLAAKEPPEGVVFEVVSSDADTLRWAVPAIRRYVHQLRERFPKLSMAVVSHGDEEFALTEANRKRYKDVHRGIKSLTDENVPVAVCGAYAQMHKISPEDFPKYVEVASSGPSEIRTYREFGFQVIHVRKPPK